MPEASVYEDDFSPARENQIRLSGQVTAVEPEAISQPVCEFADDQFRFGVLRPHLSHDSTALCPGEYIHGVGQWSVTATAVISGQ
jgi:hypothetical protein